LNSIAVNPSHPEPRRIPLAEWIYDLKFAFKGSAGQIFRIEQLHAAVYARANNHGIPERNTLDLMHRLGVVKNPRRWNDELQYVHELTQSCPRVRRRKALRRQFPGCGDEFDGNLPKQYAILSASEKFECTLLSAVSM
jgi:hypothetical protein